MHDHALGFVPDRIDTDIERGDGGVDKWVGSLDGDLGAESAEVLLGFGEDAREIAGAVCGSELDCGRPAIEAGAIGGDVAIIREFFGGGGRGGIGDALEGEVERARRRNRDASRDDGKGWLPF